MWLENLCKISSLLFKIVESAADLWVSRSNKKYKEFFLEILKKRKKVAWK